MRRLAGMRREEVAYLAGISVDYYTRLERGRVQGISEEILDAVSQALRLDEVKHDHLVSLVQALRRPRPRDLKPKHPARTKPDAVVQRVLDAMDVPAVVQNPRLDIIAANRLGWEIYPHSVAVLREAAGRDRADEELFALIRYHHPVVGDVAFDSQSFRVADDTDLDMIVLTVAPDSSTADALRILSAWAEAPTSGGKDTRVGADAPDAQ